MLQFFKLRINKLLLVFVFAAAFTVQVKAFGDELDQALKAKDKASAEYMSAVLDHKPVEDSVRAMQESEGKVAQILERKYKENQNKVFNRTYFTDGSSMPMDEFNKNPEKYLDQHVADLERKSKGGSSVGAVGAPNDGSGPDSGNDSGEYKGPFSSKTFGETPGKPGVVLDGTKLPKEMAFPVKEPTLNPRSK